MGTERTDELYKVLLTKGYPKELCAEIAYKNLNIVTQSLDWKM